MALIIDFLLLAASGAACFYCVMLSRRLKALTNAEDGFQTGIAALSQSAEDMQAALAKTKDGANESAAHLEALLEETNRRIPELQDLLQQISDLSAQAVDETEIAANNLVNILAPHINDAKETAQLLLSALEATGTAPLNSKIQDGIDKNNPDSVSKKDMSEEDKDEDGKIEFIAVDDENETAKEGKAA